jgi:hypothetical protein
MPRPVSHPGRPLAATLATGLAGGAFCRLVLAESALLPAGTAAVAGWSLVGFFLIGTFVARRFAHGQQPAARLVPLLGVVGAALPISLLALRFAVPVTGPFAAVPGLAPAGLALGLAVTTCLAASQGHPRWNGRAASLALILVGTAGLGALAARIVLTRVSPVNLALDLTLGCAAMGIVCAAGTSQQRRHETWLSLLALAAILALPLSGLIDARSTPQPGDAPRQVAPPSAPRPSLFSVPAP